MGSRMTTTNLAFPSAYRGRAAAILRAANFAKFVCPLVAANARVTPTGGPSQRCGGEARIARPGRRGQLEAPGLFSSDLPVLPAPGTPATSLGRLSSSRPSTPQAWRLRTPLLAGVEEVATVRGEGADDR